MRVLRFFGYLVLVTQVAGRVLAQARPEVSVTELTAFLTASGGSRYEGASIRARILAAEVGDAANAALAQILSQPIRSDAWHLLTAALAAASYSPIVVPESLLIRYATLRPGAGDVSAVMVTDLRVRALLALSYRPRPNLVGFWQELWETERDPVLRQFALTALACSDPDAVRPLLMMTHHSRLLNEVAVRIVEELRRGDEALLCHGGESSKRNAASFRPDLSEDARREGEALLRRAGIVK